MPETQNWPFVQAKWYTKVDPRKPRTVRLGVLHDMEFYERGDTAEVIARDFATRGNKKSDKASAHLCIDNNSIVQCVYDRDVAYAAPGANHDGIHFELAGYGKQTPEEWLDFYGIALLALSSDAAAQYYWKLGLPPVHLTNKELKAGKRGWVGHNQVSEVYRRSDHSDPGSNFPWDYWIASVNNFIVARRKAA